VRNGCAAEGLRQLARSQLTITERVPGSGAPRAPTVVRVWISNAGREALAHRERRTNSRKISIRLAILVLFSARRTRWRWRWGANGEPLTCPAAPGAVELGAASKDSIHTSALLAVMTAASSSERAAKTIVPNPEDLHNKAPAPECDFRGQDCTESDRGRWMVRRRPAMMRRQVGP
jgi:hypothetical protein